MSLETINRSLGREIPRLNELGKIKIGGKGGSYENAKGGTSRKPVKYDHFVITTLQREGGDQDGDLVLDTKLMNELLDEYGSSPTKSSLKGMTRVLREIPIQFPVNGKDNVLGVSWTWYQGRTQLGARSDGETVEWFVDQQGRKLDKPQVEPWTDAIRDWCDAKGTKYFKLTSQLSCLIRSPNARFGGIYKFRTTSEVTYGRLNDSLVQIEQDTHGILRSLPLVLVLTPVKVSPNGRVSTIYAAHIELRGGDIGQIQRMAIEEQRRQLDSKQEVMAIEKQYRKMLALPGYEAAGEIPHIVDEWHPEVAHILPVAPDHYDLIDGPAESPQVGDTPDTQRPEPTVLGSRQQAEQVVPDEGDVTGQGDSDPDVVDATIHEERNDAHGDPVTDIESDEQAEYARWKDEQDRAAAAATTETGPLDELGVTSLPPKGRPVPMTASEQALNDAALQHDATQKALTAKSTADDFLNFVVAHRPKLPNGKPSDAMGAMVIANGRMKAWLPKPGNWDGITNAQKRDAVAKVRAGKFPWPASTPKA